MSNKQNISNSQQHDTTTLSTENPKRIEYLEKQLAEKEQLVKNNEKQVQEIKEKANEAIKRIEYLEKQLAEKEQLVKNNEKQVQEIKEKANEAIKRIKQMTRNEADVKTDLTKNVIKQNTSKHNYRNGYADGTVAEEKKKILAERKKAKVGIK